MTNKSRLGGEGAFRCHPGLKVTRICSPPCTYFTSSPPTSSCQHLFTMPASNSAIPFLLILYGRRGPSCLLAGRPRISPPSLVTSSSIPPSLLPAGTSPSLLGSVFSLWLLPWVGGPPLNLLAGWWVFSCLPCGSSDSSCLLYPSLSLAG